MTHPAVTRALSMVGDPHCYVLGGGDYRPEPAPDVPWTDHAGLVGSDCWGFVAWCHRQARHRPGFNVGPWATVSDDVNCNSAIEDALHKQELFTIAPRPEPGDLIAYPTIHLPGHPQPFIGHVCIVTDASKLPEWDPNFPDFHNLAVAHCAGPDGRKPAVRITDGSIWNHHNSLWPKPGHRCQVLRVL